MKTAARDARIDIDDGWLFVRRWPAGDGGKAPIILLHDSLGSVELWREFPQALAQATAREVIAYDRLGFGRSGARGEPLAMDFVREEARRYFPVLHAALGLGRFALFGHSVGGAMAVEIAAAQGDACAALVTESAQAFVEARTLDGIRAAKAQFADPAQLARLARWHGDKARWVLQAWTDTWLSPAFADWNLDAALASVHCPLLAIHGDRDEYGSVAFPQRIAQGARGASKAVVVEGCGHVPHREREAEVLRLVAAFLIESNVD